MVSICCATYNHEKYIGQTLESFLMQEADFEVEILINEDASTDETANIIREYQKKYPDRIQCLFHKENQYSQGISPTGNLMRIAKGKYIALCEGDDYWIDRQKLKKQVNFLESNPEFVATVGNVRVVDENDQTISIHPVRKKALYPVEEEHVVSIDSREQFKLIGQTSTYCFRNIFRNMDEERAERFYNCPGGDHKFSLYLMSVGKVMFMKDTLSVHRKIFFTGDSFSARTLGKNELYKVLNSWLKCNQLIRLNLGVNIDTSLYTGRTFVLSIGKIIKKPTKGNIKELLAMIKLCESKGYIIASIFKAIMRRKDISWK